MIQKYVETEVSRKARKILSTLVEDGAIHPDSPYGREIKHLDYNSYSRKDYDGGNITDEGIVGSLLRTDTPGISLLKLCVKFNFDEKNIRTLLWDYLNNLYGPKSILDFEKELGWGDRIVENKRAPAKRIYLKMCGELELHPDPNFPDW